MNHHRIILLILLCLTCLPNRSIAAGDTPFSKICDPSNGCYVWGIKSIYFEGEEGRTCKTISDTRCHPCWRSNGKKQCAPIVANVTIQGHNTQGNDGRAKSLGTNSFYVTCTGDVGPNVTPQPSNESYPLDKRMFDAAFDPQEKAVYYNLWWAVCRNHPQKFGLTATAAPTSPPAIAVKGENAAPSSRAESEKASAKRNAAVTVAAPPSPSTIKKDDKGGEKYYFLYQQYMVLKVCEDNSSGAVKLDKLRERMKFLDEDAKKHGYDPDILYEKAKNAPLTSVHNIMMGTIKMLPMLDGSQKMEVISMCRNLAERQGEILRVMGGVSGSGSNPDQVLKKDF